MTAAPSPLTAGPSCRAVRAGAFSLAPHALPHWVAAYSTRISDDIRCEDWQALPTSIFNSSPARRRSYRAGRACAHMALRALGVSSCVVDRGHHGEPVWPTGFCGSITHTKALAYAAVSTTAHTAGIGIDSEEVVSSEVRSAVENLCLTPAELRHLDGDVDANIVATILFSAKESLFKAIFPAVRRFVDFTEVESISIDWAVGELRFGASRTGRIEASLVDATCRFSYDDGLVHTAVMLPGVAAARAVAPSSHF